MTIYRGRDQVNTQINSVNSQTIESPKKPSNQTAADQTLENTPEMAAELELSPEVTNETNTTMERKSSI